MNLRVRSRPSGPRSECSDRVMDLRLARLAHATRMRAWTGAAQRLEWDCRVLFERAGRPSISHGPYLRKLARICSFSGLSDTELPMPLSGSNRFAAASHTTSRSSTQRFRKLGRTSSPFSSATRGRRFGWRLTTTISPTCTQVRLVTISISSCSTREEDMGFAMSSRAATSATDWLSIDTWIAGEPCALERPSLPGLRPLRLPTNDPDPHANPRTDGEPDDLPRRRAGSLHNLVGVHAGCLPRRNVSGRSRERRAVPSAGRMPGSRRVRGRPDVEQRAARAARERRTPRSCRTRSLRPGRTRVSDSSRTPRRGGACRPAPARTSTSTCGSSSSAATTSASVSISLDESRPARPNHALASEPAIAQSRSSSHVLVRSLGWVIERARPGRRKEKGS